MADDNQSFSRHGFLAVVFLAFVWIGVFVILPALSGKPGIVQDYQKALRSGSDAQTKE